MAQDKVIVIGGGLAGSEAALQLAGRGVAVELIEMRPLRQTAVHKTGDCAELVCSNSLKSTNIASAAGLLKYELAAYGSKVLEIAFETRVPAGGALAVDRMAFSQGVTAALETHPLITLTRVELCSLKRYLESSTPVIVATGPLTSDALSEDIAGLLGAQSLSFYDAAAPIVEADSLDMGVLFAQSRHGRGGRADYLNAPFDKEQYDAFIGELVSAEKVIAKEFEAKDLFCACQPVEEVARSGHDALRYGALKPVGLTDPATGRRPWAAVQLRAENAAATAYNLVGFQTNLTFGEQKRVFRMIPGLADAEFSRFGVMHKNTFVDAPHALGHGFALPSRPHIRFAGQVCGTEGYAEALASGLYAALCTYAQMRGLPAPELPRHTVFGALIEYANNPATQDYQPMHVNFGIIDPLPTKVKGKRERYAAYAERAMRAADAFVGSRADLGFLPYTGPDICQVSKEDGRQEA